MNLFTHKRNSAALVGLVLIAALLAGGLVACEKADASAPTETPDTEPLNAGASPTDSPAAQLPTDSPENAARRELLKDYFYANYTEDNASVVLADLTGDGLDELLVLTMDLMNSEKSNLRQPVSGEEFAYGELTICGVKDGAAFQYNSLSSVSNSHAGWGYEYLVPRSDGNGFALFDFRAYTGDGQASYAYGVDVLDEGNDEWLPLDSGNVYFHIVPEDADSASLIMGEDVWTGSSVEEAEQLLSRVRAYKDSGVPLLVYQNSYLGITGEKNYEFAYLNTAPAEVFGGTVSMDISALRGHAVEEGGPMSFALPNPPASPEEALDLLEASVQVYEGGGVFRIPNYDGEWYINVAGRMRMGDEGDNYMSVHYLEGEEWTPGKRYSFETAEGAYYNDLNLFAVVTAPDGTQAERTIVLSGPQNEADNDLPDGDPVAMESAQANLEQLAREQRKAEAAIAAARSEMMSAQANLEQRMQEHQAEEEVMNAARSEAEFAQN